jgi:Phosphatidylinositol-specific phospholipase C, Y domain
MARDDPVYWIQYNQRQLTRVYPGGSRIDSSNLDPVTMWNTGSQLGN